MKPAIAVLALLATEALAQPGGVSVIGDHRANVGISTGPDGLLLVDDLDLGALFANRISPAGDAVLAERILLEARDAYVGGRYTEAIEIAKKAIAGPGKRFR